LVERGDLVTCSVRLLILDECNVLMAETFKEDVCWLHSMFPAPVQVPSPPPPPFFSPGNSGSSNVPTKKLENNLNLFPRCMPKGLDV